MSFGILSTVPVLFRFFCFASTTKFIIVSKGAKKNRIFLDRLSKFYYLLRILYVFFQCFFKIFTLKQLLYVQKCPIYGLFCLYIGHFIHTLYFSRICSVIFCTQYIEYFYTCLHHYKASDIRSAPVFPQGNVSQTVLQGS